jgi:tetratricopeptide (TPR) repeat protein
MSHRTCDASLCRSGIAVLATLLALECGAQPRLDPATAGILSSAIDALTNEQYGAARSLVAKLERESLSPFERSRVEQILFNVAYQERRYDAAHEHLQRAIDAGGLSEPEVAQARYQRAQMLMAEERWQDGIAALETWLATAAQPQPSAYYLLAVGYYQAGDFAKALPAVRAAIDRMEQPQESWLSLQLAVHLQEEQFHDALAVLNRLIVVAPDKRTYWLQLSSVYGALEDYGNALAIMQLAYDNGMLTESAEILRLTDMLLFNEVPLRAARVLEDSMAANTVARNETSYTKLGTAWLAAQEFDNAVEPLEHAAELSATGASFVRLGQVHMQREDWGMAEAALSRALAKGGLQDAAEAEFLMGVTLFEQGRMAEASSWFEQARAGHAHREIADRYIRVIAEQSPPRRSL